MPKNQDLLIAASTIWVVITAVLVMFMQAGFAFLEAGLTRMKNAGHIAVYGPDNHLRLTGLHETQAIDTFSYGVADRGASIRIPHSFVANGYRGYLEDRRPNSLADPYGVAGRIHYDAQTHRFRVAVSPGPDGTTATLSIMRHPGV